jgi:hypothetical protein
MRTFACRSTFLYGYSERLSVRDRKEFFELEICEAVAGDVQLYMVQQYLVQPQLLVCHYRV